MEAEIEGMRKRAKLQQEDFQQKVADTLTQLADQQLEESGRSVPVLDELLGGFFDWLTAKPIGDSRSKNLFRASVVGVLAGLFVCVGNEFRKYFRQEEVVVFSTEYDGTMPLPAFLVCPVGSYAFSDYKVAVVGYERSSWSSSGNASWESSACSTVEVIVSGAAHLSHFAGLYDLVEHDVRDRPLYRRRGADSRQRLRYWWYSTGGGDGWMLCEGLDCTEPDIFVLHTTENPVNILRHGAWMDKDSRSVHVQVLCRERTCASSAECTLTAHCSTEGKCASQWTFPIPTCVPNASSSEMIMAEKAIASKFHSAISLDAHCIPYWRYGHQTAIGAATHVMDNCEKQGNAPCALYSVNNVRWEGSRPDLAANGLHKDHPEALEVDITCFFKPHQEAEGRDCLSEVDLEIVQARGNDTSSAVDGRGRCFRVNLNNNLTFSFNETGPGVLKLWWGTYFGKSITSKYSVLRVWKQDEEYAGATMTNIGMDTELPSYLTVSKVQRMGKPMKTQYHIAGNALTNHDEEADWYREFNYTEYHGSGLTIRPGSFTVEVTGWEWQLTKADMLSTIGGFWTFATMVLACFWVDVEPSPRFDSQNKRRLVRFRYRIRGTRWWRKEEKQDEEQEERPEAAQEEEEQSDQAAEAAPQPTVIPSIEGKVAWR